MVLDFIMLGRQGVDKTSRPALQVPTLEVSQFDQTFVLAASMMVNSKEARRTYRLVTLPLASEVTRWKPF